MNLAVDFLDAEQECAVLVSMVLILVGKHRGAVWPSSLSKLNPEEVDVSVVPLDRIGAPAGASGAKVFIAYLTCRATGDARIEPSNALVIKIQKREASGENKLFNEKKAADEWPALDQFARPIHLFEVSGYYILIAPFCAPVKFDDDRTKLKFGALRDLWSGLGDDTGDVRKGIRKALELVGGAHKMTPVNGDDPARKLTKYSVEYDWYLRKTHKPREKAHATIMRQFGDEPEVDRLGKKWPNPRHVLRKLLEKKDDFNANVGPVHGDLHPKNVIYSGNEDVSVIDFGWAAARRHVVVDFVLMDINVRSMTLSSNISEADLVKAAEYLIPTDGAPKVDKIVTERLEIVSDVIWSEAINSGAVKTEDWVIEYLVPYFLVAYGLLVYLDRAQNQQALLAVVLAAGKRIHDEEWVRNA